MRARALALPLILLAPALLGGCLGFLGDEAPGARTQGVGNGGAPDNPGDDGNATTPNGTTAPTESEIRIDVNASWNVGDQWYFESNRSRWSRHMVTDLTYVNGTPYLTLVQEYGYLERDADKWARLTVDAVTYNTTRVETAQTDSRYTPADPGLRFLRNGTYGYAENVTYMPPGDEAPSREYTFRSLVRVRPVSWWNATLPDGGTCEAAWFKQFVTQWRVGREDEFSRTLREHVYCPDILYNVYYLTPSHEMFTLEGYRVGDREAGRGLGEPSLAPDPET